MKLRQRRAAGNDSAPILPLYANDSGYNSATTKRRIKRTNGFLKVSANCCFLFVAFVCLISWVAVRSSLYPVDHSGSRRIRQVWSKHKKRLEQKLSTPITCADGTFGLKDDDYCDCPDGSDEPNTAACSNLLVQKQSFRCRDGSMMVHASRVRDGMVDCPDRSDEK